MLTDFWKVFSLICQVISRFPDFAKALPNVWAMVEQLVGTVGVTEVIRIMADMSSDLPHLRLFLNVPNNAEINERVAEILRDAAGHLDFLEDVQAASQ